jgi:hypothetical protein
MAHGTPSNSTPIATAAPAASAAAAAGTENYFEALARKLSAEKAAITSDAKSSEAAPAAASSSSSASAPATAAAIDEKAAAKNTAQIMTTRQTFHAVIKKAIDNKDLKFRFARIENALKNNATNHNILMAEVAENIKDVLGETYKNLIGQHDEQTPGRLAILFFFIDRLAELTATSHAEILAALEQEYKRKLENAHYIDGILSREVKFNLQGHLKFYNDLRKARGLPEVKLQIPNADDNTVADSKAADVTNKPIGLEIDTQEKLANWLLTAKENLFNTYTEKTNNQVHSYLKRTTVKDFCKIVDIFRKHVSEAASSKAYEKNWKKPWETEVAKNLEAFATNWVTFESLKEALIRAVKASLQHENKKKPGERGAAAKGNDVIARMRRPLAQAILTDLEQRLAETRSAQELYDLLEPHISKSDFDQLCGGNYKNPDETALATSLSHLLKVHKAIAAKLHKDIITEASRQRLNNQVGNNKVSTDEIVSAFEELERALATTDDPFQLMVNQKAKWAAFSSASITARGRDYCAATVMVTVYDAKSKQPKKVALTCYQLEELMQAMVESNACLEMLSQAKKTPALQKAETAAKAAAKPVQLQLSGEEKSPAVADAKTAAKSDVSAGALATAAAGGARRNSLTSMQTADAARDSKDKHSGDRFAKAKKSLADGNNHADFIRRVAKDVNDSMGETWRKITEETDDKTRGRLAALFLFIDEFVAITKQSPAQVILRLEKQYGKLQNAEIKRTLSSNYFVLKNKDDLAFYNALRQARGLDAVTLPASAQQNNAATNGAAAAAEEKAAEAELDSFTNAELDTREKVLALFNTTNQKAITAYRLGKDKAVYEYLYGKLGLDDRKVPKYNRLPSSDNPTTNWLNRCQFAADLSESLDEKTFLATHKDNWEKPWNTWLANNLDAFIKGQVTFSSLKEALVLAVKSAQQHEATKVEGKRGAVAKGDTKVAGIRRRLARSILDDLNTQLPAVTTAQQLYAILEPHIAKPNFRYIAGSYEKPDKNALGTSLSRLFEIHKAIATKLGKAIINPERTKQNNLVADTRVSVDELVTAFEALDKALATAESPAAAAELQQKFAAYFSQNTTLRGRNYCQAAVVTVHGPLTCYQIEAFMQQMLLTGKAYGKLSAAEQGTAQTAAEALAKTFAKPVVVHKPQPAADEKAAAVMVKSASIANAAAQPKQAAAATSDSKESEDEITIKELKKRVQELLTQVERAEKVATQKVDLALSGSYLAGIKQDVTDQLTAAGVTDSQQIESEITKRVTSETAAMKALAEHNAKLTEAKIADVKAKIKAAEAAIAEAQAKIAEATKMPAEAQAEAQAKAKEAINTTMEKAEDAVETAEDAAKAIVISRAQPQAAQQSAAAHRSSIFSALFNKPSTAAAAAPSSDSAQHDVLLPASALEAVLTAAASTVPPVPPVDDAAKASKFTIG